MHKYKAFNNKSHTRTTPKTDFDRIKFTFDPIESVSEEYKI